jgi:hypothetical protein
VESVGKPLKDWNVNIYRGLLTGFNEAFIIDKDKKDQLISQDPKSAEIIRPLLRGRDIKRYSYQYTDLYLLYIPWHFPLQNDPKITGSSLVAEKAFENQFPAVYQHLLSFKEELSNRNKAETGIRYEWYALQRWGANYWEDFFRPKIIFQEMVQEPSFILDLKGEFMCLDTARIITGNDLEFIIAILNSKLFFYSVKTFYGGGGLGENGVRMKHTFFENFPMPIFSQEKINQIISIVSSQNAKDYDQIDELLNEYYQFTEEEIKIIQ